jgi:hypothetical protein
MLVVVDRRTGEVLLVAAEPSAATNLAVLRVGVAASLRPCRYCLAAAVRR